MDRVRRRFWPVTAVTVWVVASSIVAIAAYLHPHNHTVFEIYSVASRMWWAGEDLYPRQEETHELYRYSPAFAVVTSPFAMLPLDFENALWKLTNAGVFAIGLGVWGRRALPKSLTSNQLAGLFLAAFPGVIGSLYIGQANLMMVGFLLLGLTAIAEDRWRRAAGYLAAATLIKAFPLALALVVAVLFWRCFPLRFAVALLVGFALPFASQWPEYVLDQTVSWFRHLTDSVELNRDRLRSLDHLLELAGKSVDPRLFMLFGAAAGACVLAVAVWTMRSGAGRREVLLRMTAWFLTWAVLFGPSTENVTFAILAPVIAWSIVDSFARSSNWLRRTWLLASLYLVGLSYGAPGEPLNRYFETSGVTIGAIMFQVVLIGDLFTAPIPRCSSVGQSAWIAGTHSLAPRTDRP